jgi:hypothetical protein
MFNSPMDVGRLTISSNQQSTVLSAIHTLEDENRRLGANTAHQLDEIKQRLLDQASKGDPAEISRDLRELIKEGSNAKKAQRILHSLRYPEIRVRQQAIKWAHAETFEWIFRTPTSSFQNWLQAENGIYWIQGKAGSGKSTLLKYLSNHPQTRSNLEV